MAWSAPGVSFSETEVLANQQQGLTAVPVFVGFTGQSPDTLQLFTSWDDFLQQRWHAVGDVAAWPLALALRLYFDNGGTRAWVLSAGIRPDNSGALASALEATLVSEVLATESQITLLCVPDIVWLDGHTDRTLWAGVWQTMLTVSAARQGCFALLDLPRSCEAACAVLQASSGMRYAEFGATYWPHLETRYRSDEDWITVAPGAAIAAVIEQVDRAPGVWKAPANVALEQVLRPHYTPQKGAEVFEQALPVNLIRSFPGRGVRVWGCRTLTTAAESPWRFVQVRRLLSHIQSRLSSLGRFCVFEPNNEITWLKLKSICRSGLRSLWLNGALYGGTEEEAFRLYVGLEESMSEDDIRAGRLILNVKVAALYPAEFIDLSVRFTLMAAQVSKESA